MSSRLTKQARQCKTSPICLLALMTICTSPADSAPNTVRDCIAKAANAAAMVHCEKLGQTGLKQNIDRLSAAIRKRLEGPQRLVFDRSSTAWQAFFDSESAMLKLSLGLRADGLGAKLQQGSITLLYEQREQQLREHLHNLSLALPAQEPIEQ